MRKPRKNYTPVEKVAILRRHLIDHVPVSDLCDEHQLSPTLFYLWQKQFFENGPAAFASRIACHTLAGVSGVLSCLMPSSDSASITPLVMQGGPPMAPDSPQPLAPSGLVLQGADGSSVTAIGGMSSARGRQ